MQYREADTRVKRGKSTSTSGSKGLFPLQRRKRRVTRGCKGLAATQATNAGVKYLDRPRVSHCISISSEARKQSARSWVEKTTTRWYRWTRLLAPSRQKGTHSLCLVPTFSFSNVSDTVRMGSMMSAD